LLQLRNKGELPAEDQSLWRGNAQEVVQALSSSAKSVGPEKLKKLSSEQCFQLKLRGAQTINQAFAKQIEDEGFRGLDDLDGAPRLPQ
jgi:hypothetical protein